MRTPRVIAAVSLGLIAILFWYLADQNLGADESLEREFYASSDPAVEVLKVRWVGHANRMPTYTLFAKGRLSYRLTDNQEKYLLEEHEVQLSPEETRELLEIAVFGGLMEFEKQLIRERMLATQPPTVVSDGSTIFVDLDLEYYRSASNPEGGPASHRLSFDSPSFYVDRHPEITELAALTELSRRLREYRRRVE